MGILDYQYGIALWYNDILNFGITKSSMIRPQNIFALCSLHTNNLKLLYQAS